MMEWSGLSMDVMFYKGLLDKLDLKAEVFPPHWPAIQERRRTVYL